MSEGAARAGLAAAEPLAVERPPAATSRRIINMSAIAAVEAQIRAAISARPA